MAAAQLYTQDFYRNVIEPKLAPGGIFVTQSGPAGVLTCGEVFAPINHTLASVFPRVVPYTQHIPSYVDTWVRHFPPPSVLFLSRGPFSPQVHIVCPWWRCLANSCSSGR